jgi:excisionase family DNA binding protein
MIRLPSRGTAIAPKLYTVEQTAKVLGIGRTRTYDLINAGLIKSVKIGNLRRVHVRAIDEFLNDIGA